MSKPSPVGRPPRIVLVGTGDVLPGVARRLQGNRVVVRRLVVLRSIPLTAVAIRRIVNRLGKFDTLLATSREAVRTFLTVPSVRERLGPGLALEILAVGPGTRTALRRIGLAPGWFAAKGGGSAVETHLARTRPRAILYPRSARAGRRLGEALRRQGHTVHDPVVYRLGPPRPLRPAEVRTLLSADRVVVTSPSALSHLRAGLGSMAFLRLRATAGLVVLGERSARAARAHGFRAVRVAPTLAEQAFTRYLLRGLRRAT